VTTSKIPKGDHRSRQQLLDAIPTTREKFTISETARLLHRDEQQVYNLIYTGALTAMNIGTKPQIRAMYRVFRKDLIEFITADQARGSRVGKDA